VVGKGEELMMRRRLVGDEQGQGLVEYALIIALVSLASVVALGFLSGKINDVFFKSGNVLNSVDVVAAPGGTGGTGGAPVAPSYVSGASVSCSPGSGGAGTCQDSGGGTTRQATANPGSWDGSPAPTFSYEWQYADVFNTDCGLPWGSGSWTAWGTGATVDLPNTDDGFGDAMRVRVTGTNSEGSATTVVCILVTEDGP
jgi:pilus assembly protein Flp/PilA